jgi:hypothetical protein
MYLIDSYSGRRGLPMRDFTFRRAVGVAALIVSAIAPARAQIAPDTTGTIVGIVTTKEGNVPLSYSVVSAASLGRERFSNVEGVFALTGLPAGNLQLRVRHLGYSPAELGVTVRVGQTDTVRVSLAHIAVRLTAVDVHAYPECKNPGPPKASADSAFATVFDQLKQNAEQYRLLTDTYPFIYATERTLSNTLVNGEEHTERVHTMVINSTRWEYKPGSIVVRPPPRRVGSVTMNIPTLVNFAEKSFLENHCFYNGGLEAVDGVELLRVDFNAASKIKDPDVDGSMYLDPVNFQIRRSVLHLSKIPSGLRGLTETEAVTLFGELFPSVPVIANIKSVNRFDVNKAKPTSEAAANERQRLISVHFTKGKPGEEIKRPDGSSRPGIGTELSLVGDTKRSPRTRSHER